MRNICISRGSAVCILLVLSVSALCAKTVNESVPYNQGNFSFSVQNGHAVVTGFFGVVESGSVLTVPSEVDTDRGRVSVTAVGKYAFRDSKIENIAFPPGITEIGEGAFAGCRSLVSVVIPSSVKQFGSGIFRGCDALLSVPLPQGAQTVPEGYMADCKGLKTLTLPASVKEICTDAFSCCENLSSVVIGKSIQRIHDGTFSGCFALSEFTVASDSEYYEFRDNALFEKKSRILVCYPAGRRADEYTIPEGTKSIYPRAFMFTPLKMISVPDSLSIPSGLTSKNWLYFVNNPYNNPPEYHMLQVKSGSAAEKYAMKYGITFTTGETFFLEVGKKYRASTDLVIYRKNSVESGIVKTVPKGSKVEICAIGEVLTQDSVSSRWVAVMASAGGYVYPGWCFGGYLSE